MGYFPFFIDIKDKNFLVIGGGAVALRKVEKLIPFEPNIIVVASSICTELRTLKNIELYERDFLDSDLNKADFAVAATDDEALNARIFRICRDRKIPVNTVDDKEKCSFIFPALSCADGVTIGISTDGKSPLYASYLRKKTDSILDERTIKIGEILSRWRHMIKSEFLDEKTRCEVNGALLSYCLGSEDLPGDSEIREFINELKGKYSSEN